MNAAKQLFVVLQVVLIGCRLCLLHYRRFAKIIPNEENTGLLFNNYVFFLPVADGKNQPEQ